MRIDFHSHILPGADHGSDGALTSAGQLKLMRAYGVQTVVATPHFYPQKTTVEAFLNNRRRCAEELKRILRAEDPTLYLGAEVLICPGMEELNGLHDLCVAGTDALLLEMPFRRFDDDLYDTVAELARRKDLKIVLAHIDRYNAEDVEALLDLGVYAQINASVLASFFTRRKLRRFLEDERLCAFGSDLHMENEGTMKAYGKGLSKIGAEKEEEINRRTSALLQGALAL